MRRTVYLALLVFSLSLIFSGQACFAQEARQTVKSNPEWKPLQEGVQAATVWDTIGPQWPQTVLLQLREDEYKKFLSDRVKYINELKVLGTSHTHKVILKHVPKENYQHDKDQQYLVIIGHEQDTVIYALAFKIPK